jgi:hypothetical protein
LTGQDGQQKRAPQRAPFFANFVPDQLGFENAVVPVVE